MKKNIWFVQPSFEYAGDVYLPYGTGCLAAFAWNHDIIKKNFSLCGFIFKREALTKVQEKIKEPFLVAFSCNIWSQEYNNAVAHMIKEAYPKCIIVFGGHNISSDTKNFDNNPDIDFLMEGEGEIPFFELLKSLLLCESADNISGIYHRNSDGKFVCNVKNDGYPDLGDFPSPYLEGIFDSIIKDSDNSFSAILETNRGCPYGCAFCDWCYSKKLRFFPIEKVKREISWFAEKKIDYFFCSDSNFGIAERDEEIAKYLVDTKLKYGFPRVMGASYSKESNDTVFRISQLFFEHKINKAATLSVQSLCYEVLKNIGRKNLSKEQFMALSEKYNSAGIPTYTDLILGLPGETFESFSKGLCELLEMGQHTAVSVYYCQVYPNTPLSTAEYQKEYGIKTALVPINHLHSCGEDESEIQEYCNTIVETASMSRDMLQKSVLFSAMVQCCHHIGLLKYIAIYLHEEKGIAYYNFYCSLFEYIFSKESGMLKKIFEKLRSICDKSQGEWTYENEIFGSTGWFLDEGAFLEIVFDFENFKKDVVPFLTRYLDLKNEKEAELIRYQWFSLRIVRNEPVNMTFSYNFTGYFKSAVSGKRQSLTKEKNTVTTTEEEIVTSWRDYGERIMLFAKRRGATVLFNDKSNFKIEYE